MQIFIVSYKLFESPSLDFLIMSKIHISLTAETIGHIGDFAVTNSLLTSWIVVGTLFLITYLTSKSLQKNPSKKQLLVELPFKYMKDLAENVAGDKAKIFFPFIMTYFLYILISNWSGLIPGVGTIGIWEHGTLVPLFRAPTADLNATLALAIVSVFSIQYFGVKSLGMKYFSKFFNFSNPIYTFVGFLELISELSKVISFAFRLFGNIFAGEVLLTVIAFLIPVMAPIPFYGLELFVGLIQAFVFAILSLVFLNIATQEAAH